jgi:hypothetical protein
VVDQFWGSGEEAHRGGWSAVEGIGGGEKTPASWSRGHQLGQSGWGGITRWRGAGGVTRPKRGWSGLSAAARVARGGAVVRARRVCRGRSGSDRAADGWPPRGFNFSNLTKTSSNLEFEKECCLTLLQKIPNFSCC